MTFQGGPRKHFWLSQKEKEHPWWAWSHQKHISLSQSNGSVSYQAKREIAIRQTEGLLFPPWFFWYFTTINLRSNNGTGWPDNYGLDELHRAPSSLCDGELEFVTTNWTSCFPYALQYTCGKREGWARKGKYDSSLKVCFEHPPLQSIGTLRLKSRWATRWSLINITQKELQCKLLPFLGSPGIGSCWGNDTGCRL